MQEDYQAQRCMLVRKSSMAPEKTPEPLIHSKEEVGVRLMYLSNEGNIAGIKEFLDSGIDDNYRGFDDRTALHVAASQGLQDVVEFLLDRKAEVDPKDRWGSTPLADVIFYKNIDVNKILQMHGANHPMSPPREVPEYEINPSELDFTQSNEETKVKTCHFQRDVQRVYGAAYVGLGL